MLVGAIAATGARADADGAGWIPSLSVGVLAHAQDAEGGSISSFPARTSFEPNVQGDPLILVPSIPVGLKLDAPEFVLRGVVLRPFVQGRYQIPMDPDRTIARQGTLPKPVQLPSDPAPSLQAGALSGQGTLLTATLDLVGQVGVGLSSALPVEVIPLRLSVSLDYLVERISMEGEVVYVRGTGPREIAPFQVQRLLASKELFFHYLGPRLELESSVGKRGPIAISVFTDFGAHFALGDRSGTFRAADIADSADFDFKVSPWMIQAGVGLRLAWAGW